MHTLDNLLPRKHPHKSPRQPPNPSPCQPLIPLLINQNILLDRQTSILIKPHIGNIFIFYTHMCVSDELL